MRRGVIKSIASLDAVTISSGLKHTYLDWHHTGSLRHSVTDTSNEPGKAGEASASSKTRVVDARVIGVRVRSWQGCADE